MFSKTHVSIIDLGIVFLSLLRNCFVWQHCRQYTPFPLFRSNITSMVRRSVREAHSDYAVPSSLPVRIQRLQRTKTIVKRGQSNVLDCPVPSDRRVPCVCFSAYHVWTTIVVVAAPSSSAVFGVSSWCCSCVLEITAKGVTLSLHFSQRDRSNYISWKFVLSFDSSWKKMLLIMISIGLFLLQSL